MAVGTSQKMATVGVVRVAKPKPPTAFSPEPTKAAQKTTMKAKGVKTASSKGALWSRPRGSGMPRSEKSANSASNLDAAAMMSALYRSTPFAGN